MSENFYFAKDMDNLAAYNSSDSEEESPQIPLDGDRKRKLNEGDPDAGEAVRKRPTGPIKTEKLPLPNDIVKMFEADNSEHSDDPSKHGGRIRSFAHERGNWASYVHIPSKQPVCHLSDDSWCREMADSVIKCLRLEGEFHMVDHFHISLSRTFVMRHHWIDPMVESLRTQLATFPGTLIDFSSVELYTNDDKSRTFLGIKVCSGSDMLQRYMAAVDRSLSEFRLPTYYENPSFHMSLAWSLGDVKTSTTPSAVKTVQRTVDEYFCSNPRSSVIGVKRLLLKTGNKEFVLRTT